ncbi:glycosyltransferase [Vibrio salinus]|uniref:glycosyltransferase n=1 Tax=Vibrio salinus TaxID=2899784 RepID=UPI001E41BD00|nr:glycosyltransferase [Vibrio salinus]MCE0493801.1 glycosyltransferase [Vibrio salinus]
MKKHTFTIIQNSIKTTYLFRASYIKILISLGDVYIIAPNDDTESKLKLEEIGAHVYGIRSHTSILNLLHSIITMNFLTLKHVLMGSTIISHFIVTTLLIYPSLIFTKKPCFIYTEGLGSFIAKSTLAQKILKFLLNRKRFIRLFCNKSDRFILGNPDDYVSNGIGIDIDKFKPRKKDIREKFNLLFVGRLISDKGINDAIHIFKQLEKKYDICLTVVGSIYPNNPTSLNQESINNIKKEYKSKINFIGYTKEITHYYESSDILLLPSIREGFPVCIMEASSMGIPSIGYDVPGVSDAIENGINGYKVPLKNINELMKVTEYLLDRKVLNNLRHSCRKHAEVYFDSEIKNKEFINLIYKKIC